MKASLIISGVLLVLSAAATGLTLIKPGEKGVVRRFGRVVADQPGPGLYRGLPWGMEQIDRVPVDAQRRITVGYVGGATDDGTGTPTGQLLTGDHNLVNVQAEIYYKVNENEVEKFALQADRVEPLLTRLAEAALAEWIAGRKVDDVLVLGKLELPAYVRATVQERLLAYDLGVEIQRASIIQLNPPDDVKAAFEEVAKAHTRKDTQIKQAEQKAKSKLNTTKAMVYEKERFAAQYAQAQKLGAEAEAATFRKQLALYTTLAATDPNYLNALWLDQMTRIYAQMKESGRIDVLDHYLSKEGLTITQFPLLPKKK